MVQFQLVLISTPLDILGLDILGLDILGLDILGLDILGHFRHKQSYKTNLCHSVCSEECVYFSENNA